MSVRKFRSFHWDGTEERKYKDVAGSHRGVTRRLLAKPEGAGYELRYFEVQPGGFTSHEYHEHEHVVVVIRGKGLAVVGGEWFVVEPFDVVEVGAMQPHQFRNDGAEAFGFLCIVDAERDRPVLVSADTEPGEDRQ